MKKFVLGILIVLIVFLGLFVFGEKDIDAERIAIEQAAMDYIEGWYEGNADRMERALHPEMVRRAMIPDAEGKEYFQNLAKPDIIRAAEGGGGSKFPAEERQIAIKVIALYKTIASARVDSGSFIDFLHFGKTEGGWKIVNALWLPNVKERNPVRVDPEILKEYEGEYELTPEFAVSVTLKDGRLYVQGTGQPPFELFAESDTVFFLKDVPATLNFVRGEQGRVTHVILEQGGGEATAKKIK